MNRKDSLKDARVGKCLGYTKWLLPFIGQL